MANAFDAAAILAVDARASVAARLRCARIDRLLAIRTAEIRRALANVAAVCVVADAAVQARVPGEAFVDVVLAQRARVAGVRAIALEAAHLVDAQPIILARLRFTVVPIRFATIADESFDAFAFDFGAAGGHFTRAIIQTWLTLAQRMHADLCFAMRSGEAGRTVALIVTAIVFGAGGAMLARFRLTRRPGVHFAVLATVSRRAMALVAVGPRDAGVVLHTRIVHTMIDWRAHEHILVRAGTLHQRARPEHRHLRVHCARVENQSGAVQHAARVCGAQYEDGRFVANLLIGQEECVVGGVRDHRSLAVHDEIKIAQPIQELQCVPSIVQQIGGHASLDASIRRIQ